MAIATSCHYVGPPLSALTKKSYLIFTDSSAIDPIVQWPKPPLSSSTSQAVLDLIARVLDNAPTAQLFQVNITSDQALNGKDVFELTNGAQPGSILISASSGVAAAWGFNYYLKYVANSSCRIFSLFLSIFGYCLLCVCVNSLLVRQEYSAVRLSIDSSCITYSNSCE